MVAVPLKVAVIIPALNPPDPSLKTIVSPLLSLVALLVIVAVVEVELSYVADPLIPLPEVLTVKVWTVPVIIPEAFIFLTTVKSSSEN